jgi:hypothetical protein
MPPRQFHGSLPIVAHLRICHNHQQETTLDSERNPTASVHLRAILKERHLRKFCHLVISSSIHTVRSLVTHQSALAVSSNEESEDSQNGADLTLLHTVIVDIDNVAGRIIDNELIVITLNDGALENATIVEGDGCLAIRKSAWHIDGIADGHLSLGHLETVLGVAHGGAVDHGTEGQEEEGAEELHDDDDALLVGVKPREGLQDVIEGWESLV